MKCCEKQKVGKTTKSSCLFCMQSCRTHHPDTFECLKILIHLRFSTWEDDENKKKQWDVSDKLVDEEWHLASLDPVKGCSGLLNWAHHTSNTTQAPGWSQNRLGNEMAAANSDRNTRALIQLVRVHNVHCFSKHRHT